MPVYRNEGGPKYVVEAQKEVAHGETVKGSDALAAVHGFVLVEKPAAKDKPKDEN